jgi:FtsH-binding integral membrane protein
MHQAVTMTRQRLAFFLSGLIAGTVSVTLVALTNSPELTALILTYGAGILSFIGLISGLVISGTSQRMRVGTLRYVAVLILTVLSYLTAVCVFFVVLQQSAEVLGHSRRIPDFTFGVWLGLAAASIIGAVGTTLLTTIMTNKWSFSLLTRLIFAATVTILTTYIINFPFHSPWSFFGVLLPLGNALFSYLVGMEVSRSSNQPGSRQGT